MRRAVASKKPGRIALGGALFFNILVLSMQTSQQPGAGPMRTWLLEVVTPVEKAVDTSINSVWSIWDGYIGLIGVRHENEKLRAENDQLRMQIGGQSEDLLEATRLRGLLNLSDSGLGKTVVARIIGRDPSHAHHTVTIDKGRDDGIMHDMSIITPDGVVGRVFHASKSSAVVQLITDSQSSIAGMVRSTRVQAVFKGVGSTELELDYIDNDNEIKVGDELITSGLDQVHPKGLPLGVVVFVGPNRGLLKDIRIRPAADLSRIEEVICVVEHAPPVTDPLNSNSSELPSD